MKKYSILLFFLIFALLSANAQIDRSKKPEPGPAPVINIGDYKKFELKNGLTVIVVENDKLPRIAFSLIVDRDPISEGEKAGFLSLVGEMMRSGTTNRSKDEIDAEIDFIGASIYPSSTSLYAAALSKHQEKLLDLMTDILYNPTFPAEELEKLKKQTLSGLTAEKDDPNAIASNVSTVLTYGKDHPYGEIETEETVENIEVEDIRNYYQTYFKPNISYLAMVGDISFKDAKKLAKKYFDRWERAEVPDHINDVPPAPEKTYVAMVNRPNAVQSVLNITYPVELKVGTQEAIKANVMNRVLGGGSSGRLFKNIREEKGYTYGAYSSLSSDELVGEFSASASVRTEVTDSAVTEFLAEMKRIRETSVEDMELTLAKNEISGSFIRGLESPQTIARFAINTERLNLPEDYYKNYIKTIQSVSKEEVQNLAEKYILPEHAYIVAVGKASDMAPAMEKFGTIQYYDMYGNETEAPNFDLPADLTAEKVLQDYVAAIGGEEALAQVEDMKVELVAETPQGNLTVEVTQKAPFMSSTITKMGENVFQEVIFNGTKGVQKMMGQTMPMSDDQVADTKIQSAMFTELYLLNEADLKYKLSGMQEVDGEDAYVVELTMPSGSKTSYFFSKESGLKLKQSSVMQSPQGEITQTVTYGDYQEVDGIMFPFSQAITVGPQNIPMKITTIKINKGVDEEIFVIQ